MRTYGNVYFRANGILNGELNTQVTFFIAFAFGHRNG